MNIQLLHGDCLEILPTLPDNSVDSIVTDPPYGLSFMGKDWDHGVPGEHFWREALRVAKPGAHLLAFGGTRTYHRLAVAIEDAGWELRDSIGVPHESGDWGDCPWLMAWTYGSGFPKSLDVSKAIDKAAGAEHLREFKCKNPADRPYTHTAGETSTGWQSPVRPDKTHPATPEAQQWAGWGTALKPAWEPIIVARKPLVGTVAENVQKYGTGAINVDGCRVETNDTLMNHGRSEEAAKSKGKYGDSSSSITHQTAGQAIGRWPANLIHDGSQMVMDLFPNTGKSAGGFTKGSTGAFGKSGVYGAATGENDDRESTGFGDSGSAARFFYCAKASKADRDEGCEGMELNQQGRTCYDPQYHEGGGKLPARSGNHHPTVKPTALMRYLCRLVTPPNGTILDPFMGSGSTGKAATREGFNFIGIEKDAEYIEICRARIPEKKSLGAN